MLPVNPPRGQPPPRCRRRNISPRPARSSWVSPIPSCGSSPGPTAIPTCPSSTSTSSSRCSATPAGRSRSSRSRSSSGHCWPTSVCCSSTDRGFSFRWPWAPTLLSSSSVAAASSVARVSQASPAPASAALAISAACSSAVTASASRPAVAARAGRVSPAVAPATSAAFSACCSCGSRSAMPNRTSPRRSEPWRSSTRTWRRGRSGWIRWTSCGRA